MLAGLPIASLLSLGGLLQVNSTQSVCITNGTAKPFHVFTWTVYRRSFSINLSEDQVNQQIHLITMYHLVWGNSSTAVGVSSVGAKYSG